MDNVRKHLFWMLHRLKGDNLESHYAQLQKLLGEGNLEKNPVNMEGLSALLHHALVTVPFYEGKEFSDVSDFPVLNKSEIRGNFDRLLSKVYTDQKLVPMVTSGSTGTPFKVVQNKDKRVRTLADTIFFTTLAGYAFGNDLYYMKIFAKKKMKPKFVYFLQKTIPVDVIKLDDAQIERIILRMQSHKKPFFITGYSSALGVLAKYLVSHDRSVQSPDCTGIVSIAESLEPDVKSALSERFGCEVYSRYSNLENGIIAQQVPGSEGKYLVNTASYAIEILDVDGDTVLPVGETGRIVVTDLFNYAMPMIRYDTGDIGSIEVDPVTNRVYLTKVEGRKLDLLYDTNGNLVSSYIVYKNMWNYTEITQYQLVQNDRAVYTLKLNVDEKFLREEELISEFKEFLGGDAKFTVEYVDEIPLLRSGKRRFIVNEMVGT